MLTDDRQNTAEKTEYCCFPSWTNCPSEAASDFHYRNFGIYQCDDITRYCAKADFHTIKKFRQMRPYSIQQPLYSVIIFKFLATTLFIIYLCNPFFTMLMIINFLKFASVYVLRTSTVILVSDNILDLELNRRGSMVKNVENNWPNCFGK